MDISGKNQMVRKMSSRLEKLRADLLQSVKDEAERTIDKAKEKVSVDTGQLRDSGKSEVQTVDNKIEVILSFSGPHAVAIHEHPSKHSPPTWRNVRDERGRFRKVNFSPAGTGPKYLENAMKEMEPGLLERVGSRIKI